MLKVFTLFSTLTVLQSYKQTPIKFVKLSSHQKMGSLQDDINMLDQKIKSLQKDADQRKTNSLYDKYILALDDLNAWKQLEKNEILSKLTRSELVYIRESFFEAAQPPTDGKLSAVQIYKINLLRDKWLHMLQNVREAFLRYHDEEFMSDIDRYMLAYETDEADDGNTTISEHAKLRAERWWERLY